MAPHETAVISEAQLPNWLLGRVPAIRDSYAQTLSEHYGDSAKPKISAYFVLSFVLRPHLEALLQVDAVLELERIFGLLEHLAIHGDAAVKNELGVTIDEEMGTSKVWRYLGQAMRRSKFESLTWFPTKKDRNTSINTQVDRANYERRWQEEVEKVGGFENLVVENELVIRHKLVAEFGIKGTLAPEPGGRDWMAWNLRWPWPAD